MDDTTTQQPSDPVVVPDSQPQADSLGSMSDVAGMTPPPAPVMSDTAAGAAVPSTDMPAADDTKVAGAEDDYSYAEDVLNEILDSLDRIEAKLEAMEKKG